MIKKIFSLVFAVLAVFQFQKSYGQKPNLAVNDISFPHTMNLNVGNIDEFVYAVTNSGQFGSYIDSIYFNVTPDPDIIYFPSSPIYYLTKSRSLLTKYYNIYFYHLPTSYYPLSTSGTNYIDTTMIRAALLSSNNIGVSDTIFVHIPFMVNNCSGVGGLNKFWADTGHSHMDTVPETTNVNVNNSKEPHLTAKVLTPLDTATWCPALHKDTMTIRFLYANNASPSILDTSYARADSIRLYVFCDPDMGDIDPSTMEINGVNVSSVTSSYTSSGKNIYVVDLPQFPAGSRGSVFGGGNTLRDWSGCLHAASLAEGGTFELTATFKYNTTACPNFSDCPSGSKTYMLPYIVSVYNNQCMTMPIQPKTIPYSLLPYRDAVYEYFYEPLTSVFTAPPDVRDSTYGPFVVHVCPNFSQFWGPGDFFDCPDGYYQLNLTLPHGYHLYKGSLWWRDSIIVSSSTQSNIYCYNPYYITTPPVTCPGRGDTLNLHDSAAPFFQENYVDTTITVNFGKLKLSNCSGTQNTYNLPCLNIPLYVDCSQIEAFDTALLYKRTPDNLSFTLQYVCDSNCSSCVNTLLCDNTITYRHCNGGCTSVPWTDDDFTFQRYTLGYINQDIGIGDFYTTCGLSTLLQLTDLVSPTSTINLSAAYPGDGVEEKVTGGFGDTLAHFKDVFLQLNQYTISVSGSRDLFELDSNVSSTFTISGDTHVPGVNITMVIPASAFSVITATNPVEMSFSLFKAVQNSDPGDYAAFISDAGYENLHITADIHLRVKTKPFVSGYQFLTGGDWPIPGLRTQFYTVRNSGDSVWSCDSWGTLFELYQPSVSSGFSADTNPSGCTPMYVRFTFNPTGALYALGQDDFPNEFRPYAELDSNLSVFLPTGYTYLSSEFIAFMDNYYSSLLDNYFASGSSSHTFTVNPLVVPVSGGTMVNFTGLNSNCWPLVDSKYPGISNLPGYEIRVYVQPACNEPDTGTFRCYYTYKINAQQSDTNIQVLVAPVAGYNYFLQHHVNPIFNVKLPPTVSDYSNTISFTFQACDSGTTAMTDGWIALQNTGGYILNISTATLTDITTTTIYTSVPYTDTAKGVLFNIGRLNPGVCDSFRITVTINDTSIACPPPIGGGTGILNVFWGNICSGTLSSPDSACQDTGRHFTYHVYPASLSLTNNGYSPSPISLCGDTLVDSLRISSDDLGTISNPSFWTSLPPGVSLYKVVYQYPCGGAWDTILYTPDMYALNSLGIVTAFGWNLNNDLHINGLQGTLGSTLRSGGGGAGGGITSLGGAGGGTTSTTTNNTVCVKVYMIMSCDYKDSAIKFYTIGTTTCGIIDTASTSIIPSVDSSCCRTAHCYNLSDYDIVINNTTASALGVYNYDNKKILVIGCYTVDANDTIKSCEVQFAPRAWVNIINNSTLNIWTDTSQRCAHLHAACDTMWGGIYITAGSTLNMPGDGVLVEDADTAVVAENTGTVQATYFISYDYFNKNYKDIVTEQYNGRYSGKVHNNVFTCRNLPESPQCIGVNWRNMPKDSLLYPHRGEITYMGWDIESVNDYKDNGSIYNFASGRNVFDNMTIGIFANSTNLTISADAFQYINTGNYLFPAIFAEGDSTNNRDTLIVGGQTALSEPNIFSHCTTGVFADNSFRNVNVSYNKFHCDTTTISATYGIVTTGPMSTGSTIIIDSNIIDSASIGILGILNTNTNAQIDSNTIIGAKSPIDQYGMVFFELLSPTAIYRVKTNTINSLQYGIAMAGTTNDTVYNNTISLSSCSACYSSLGAGVALFGGSNAQVVFNHISTSALYEQFVGIFQNLHPNAFIRCNDITATNYGIQCDGAATLISTLYQNELYASSTGTTTGVRLSLGSNILTQGSSTNASDNYWNGAFNCTSDAAGAIIPKFYVEDTLGSNWDPNRIPCTTVNAIYNILPSPICGSAPPPIVLHRDLLEQIANGHILFASAQDTNMELAKQALISILWSDTTLLADTVLRHFNDSISTMPLGILMAADTTFKSTNAAVLYLALSAVNSITPATNIDTLLQKVAQIVLNAEIYHLTTLPVTQINTLRDIANMCPDINGLAVYQAQTALSYYNVIYPPTINNCPSGGGFYLEFKKQHTDTVKEVTFNLFPNPNNGGFTLEYQLQKGQSGTFTIFDMFGNKIISYQLDPNKEKMNINETILNNGVYLYNIVVNNSIVKKDKLVIIKQ